MLTTILEIFIYTWYTIFAIFMIYLYFKNSKPYSSKYKSNPDFNNPKNLNPAKLSFLMYHKIIPTTFTTTILFLIKRGKIKVIKENNDYILINQELDINLCHSQKYVLEIIFNNIGDGEKVSINEIGNYAINNNNSSNFLLNYQIWKKIIFKEIATNNYYEDKREYHLVQLYKYITILIIIINYFFGIHNIFGYLLIIPMQLLIIYFYRIYKRTKNANDDYYKWLNFKRKLQHVKLEEVTKEQLPAYWIYALLLGIGKEFAMKTNREDAFPHLLDVNINKVVLRSALYGNRSISGFKN